MIDTVLFDLDTTLVDGGPGWRRSASETISRVRKRHPSHDLGRLRSACYAAAGSVWDETRGVEAPPWGNMDDEQTVRRARSEALAGVRLADSDTLEDPVPDLEITTLADLPDPLRQLSP